MVAMTAQETWDFLMEGTRTAHLATVRADGRPHVKPGWYELSGAPGDFQLVFTTGAATVAGRNLRRDGRCTARHRELTGQVRVAGPSRRGPARAGLAHFGRSGLL